MTSLRFAVLADPARLEPWQSRCLEELQRLPGVTLIEANAQLRPATGIDLDFILSWSDPPAELLTAARYGVWKYQFGDWTHYRGEPAGFWEVHERQSVSAAMLVRLTTSPDTVIVLREGYVRSNLHSAARNRSQLQHCCISWAAQLCNDIRNGVLARISGELAGATRRTSAAIRTAPTPVQLLQHRMRIVTRLAQTAWRDLFRHDQWNVGVVEQPIAAFLGAPPGVGGDAGRPRARTRWLPEPGRSEILADPFGVVRDSRLTVLAEKLSYETDRGVIVAVEPAGAAGPRRDGAEASRAGGPTGIPVEIGPVPRVHLSYPYLLEVAGRTYCIPETHQAREVALYELERFPDRWRKVANLLSDTVIVDVTPFTHGGLWWLAGSEAARKGASCELHLWYAPQLTGPWRPHPGNPVKVDVRSARPGGTPFVVDGVLYRPAQDCAKTYGSRVVINRVITLTPTAFEEEFAAAVDPDSSSPYPDGLHTLSAVGELTLIDGKRTRFIPALFVRTLRSWLGIRAS